MPPIVVTGRDEKITTRHKRHAEEKVSKLSRYFDGIVKIEAILSHPTATEAEAELLMSVRGGGKPLVCHCRSKDLYAAIDLVIDKAESQLTRYKEKLKARKGSSQKEVVIEEAALAPEDDEDEGYPEAIPGAGP